MVTVRSLEEYRQIQLNRAKKLREGSKSSPIKAAKYMVAVLRATCPKGEKAHDYPHMINTIRRSENRVRCGGVNQNNGFPYVHWVNATPGADLETIKLGHMKRVSYADVAKTGVPGFFWKAQIKTREVFKDAMLSVTRGALSSKY